MGRRTGIGRGGGVANDRDGDGVAGHRASAGPDGRAVITHHLAGIGGGIVGISHHVKIDGDAIPAGQVADHPGNGEAGGVQGVDGDRRSIHRHGPLAVIGPVLVPAQGVDHVVHHRHAVGRDRSRSVAHRDGHGDGGSIFGIVGGGSAGGLGQGDFGRHGRGRGGGSGCDGIGLGGGTGRDR